MARHEAPGKYGTIKSSTTTFHRDEPLFLLRGTDPFAVPMIVEYARRLERAGAEKDYVDDIVDVAMRMAEWQRDNP
jgi:hypothetical protein